MTKGDLHKSYVLMILITFLASTWFGQYTMRGVVDFLANRADFYHEKFDYFFDGANHRGYLDLCNVNGQPDVVYRDECDAG